MPDNTKIITQYWGELDPQKIEAYLEVGGYKALEKFIGEMKPEEVISEVKKSGLCGRGGAGFPTGEKWEIVAAKKSPEKYFICNLEESEPGTYKDRMIAENNPHLLLEGIIIAALAVGAKRAFIYINGHYEKQREILEKALEQAHAKFFWGKNILKSGYCLKLALFSGGGAYVCGEETALINSMEGNRGEPKLRPPYPTESGLLGKPTLINNAETIANIPWIILQGGDKYKKIGPADTPGTKLFLLNGAVKKPGLIEAPVGLSLREMIESYGGGMKAGKDFWFAQVGGACGRLFLEKELEEHAATAASA